MITIEQDWKIARVYTGPRLSRKYVGSLIFELISYPMVYRTYDVFEGWGCRILEHYPGQQGVHVGRYLGED